MELFETPDHPAPPGAELLSLRTRDGLALRATRWRPQPGRTPRGTVLVMQGRAEFIEKYYEVVGELLARDFAVVTFDWRGQGGSDDLATQRARGHARHFADFRHDVDAVRETALADMPGPVVALAHSMGGCIALTAAAEGWLPADRLVTVAPMIGLTIVRHGGLVRTLTRLLGLFGLAGRLVPGGTVRSISTGPFAGNRLSGDEARYRRNAIVAAAIGTAAIGSPTIGWVSSAYDAMARLAARGFGAAIRIPVLMLAAGDDPVCSTLASERFAQTLPPGSFVVIPGARHEILMETDTIRTAFWEAFDRFVSAGEALERRLVEPRIAAGQDGAALGGRPAGP